MAGRKKGTPKTGGAVKGVIRKKTDQWNQLGESITTTHADKFNSILDGLQGAAFIDAYTKVLSYFKPQLARTEVKAEVDNTVIIKEVNADNSFTKPTHQSTKDS